MRFLVVCAVASLCGWLPAQQPVAQPSLAALQTLPAFPLQHDGLSIRRHVEAGKPFTVAGAGGVVLGQQEGTFEAWILPVKLLSHFTLRAEVEGYPVPIDLNAAAGEIEVFPDHTTITYSHIAFTVKQTMFAPAENQASEAGTGAVVLFQIDSTRPMDLTFSFTPEMRPMWPQPGQGVPSPEWVKRGTSGFYLLHTDFNTLSGAVALPGASSGVLAPYQEKPQVHPVEFRLHYDPKRDGNRFFPLLMAVGQTAETATEAVLEKKLQEEDAELPALYARHAARYSKMAADLTSIQTPDRGLNDDFSWAVLSIEQLKATAQPSGEIGLVAGYFSSGDSARPGFGWYFGRDTLYTLYAVNGFGDFALTRSALDFLIGRQRDDGKMMHEYSQTAAFVAWKDLPYLYAAADSTPLFLTAMLDYVRSSGDVAFLQRHRDAVEKAWRFEITHDSDGDGIYDNAQGTGWVESWPGGMPHQEIYLALFDQQASSAMARLAALLGDKVTSEAAAKRAEAIRAKIEAEYYDAAHEAYAFSHNPDGTTDRTATIYPAVAWWNGGPGLEHPDASFRRWASHDFSTDWGARDVAESDPVYDPISYHQGSVWPLFTGWTSVAEYRTGRSLSGFAHLMQTADQTTNQDLGAVTELLSGAYFQPFGRSTSHQLWSSAMVVIPALRGLFGIEVDGLERTVRLNPHLPADWNEAHVEKLRVGTSICSLDFKRDGRSMVVHVQTTTGEPVRLASPDLAARPSKEGQTISFALPAVEIAIPHGLPLPGARTAQMKVLSQTADAHSLRLELEGQAGSVAELSVRRNLPKLNLHAEGAVLTDAVAQPTNRLGGITVTFPPGEGYQQQVVTLRW